MQLSLSLSYIAPEKLVGFLVDFYGVSTFVGYLIPNPL